MGIIRTIERRHEPRISVDVGLVVWGIDVRAERFLQHVRARDISLSGALLSGLDPDLRSGDVVGILYAGRKARFHVVWVRYHGNGEKMQAAVHGIEPDPCPWESLLSEIRQRERLPSASRQVKGDHARRYN